MTIKRNVFIKRLALIGIDLGQISVKLTFYGVIAAITFFFGAGFLVYNLPNPQALAGYIIIMLLVISWQIAHMIRVDREKAIHDGSHVEIEHYMDTHQLRGK